MKNDVLVNVPSKSLVIAGPAENVAAGPQATLTELLIDAAELMTGTAEVTTGTAEVTTGTAELMPGAAELMTGGAEV
jgi:X-X-X-Leu-X-X-Gly heptad repeat protein